MCFPMKAGESYNKTKDKDQKRKHDGGGAAISLSITSWSNPTPHWFHHDLHRTPPLPLPIPKVVGHPLISANRTPSGGGGRGCKFKSDMDKGSCAGVTRFLSHHRPQKLGGDFWTQVRRVEWALSAVARVTPSGGRRNAIHGGGGWGGWEGVDWGKQICLSLVTTEMYSVRGQLVE